MGFKNPWMSFAERRIITMNKIDVYFSDYFNIDKEIIESYGTIDISLINDLPLFIDLFLLFNSTNEDFQQIHEETIKYLLKILIRTVEKQE